MSQDLFAAFGDPAVEEAAAATSQHASSTPKDTLHANPTSSCPPASSQSADDDDFGDFEDASAAVATGVVDSAVVRVKPHTEISVPSAVKPSESPPKAQKREDQLAVRDSKIGKHPFAGHMDFLFAAGDDEYDAGADDLDNLANNPEAAMAYSKRIIAEQEARASNPLLAHSQRPVTQQRTQSGHLMLSAGPKADRGKFQGRFIPQNVTNAVPSPKPMLQADMHPTSNSPQARNNSTKKSDCVPAKDPYVLFDAENLSEDEDGDDFGEFESESLSPIVTSGAAAAAQPVIAPSMPNIDLLGLNDKPPVSLSQVGPTTSSSLRMADVVLGPPKDAKSSSLNSSADSWTDFKAQTTEPSQSSISVGGAAEDDAWDDFETTEPRPEIASAAPAASSGSSGKVQNAKAIELDLAPTNIPPPVLLLSVFPSIFSSAQDALLGPVSKLDSPQRNQLLSHPATYQFLRSFLNSAITLAYIIAGRKLRWKRDSILAQSMRMGPAAAGGKGGMKLAGIDRSEVAKEDREVLDAVRLWKGQVGKLRGAVTAASSASIGASRLPQVPEISERMPVKTMKAVEGGFTAPHACAICGLKREERVAKVDEDVEDSFGEWWVQGVNMHVTCKNWWNEHKNKLRSR